MPLKKIYKNNLFSILAALTIFFVLLEISFVIRCSGFYLGDFKLIANHLRVPLQVIPGVLYFIFVQFIVHVAYLFLIWTVTQFCGYALRYSEKGIDRLGIALWLSGVITVLLLNHYFFPNSKYADLLMLNDAIVRYLLMFFSLFWSVVLLVACYGLMRMITRRGAAVLGAGSVAVLLAFYGFAHHQSVVLDGGSAEKPNIIIIGVDSLRPDFLGFFGSSLPTPHIDYFLNGATVFTESLTAIARTYPSWVSILLGEYPKISQVRTNLANQNNLDLSYTLPAMLRNNGYETIFSTDETRFSNIDQRFGFDKVITPPIGFNDFLLGAFNDFPLSNLLVNTPIGKYLFPHSYGNRPVITTYEPDTFLHLLNPVLAKSRNKPVFLITHFCLTHFPYAWAGLPVKQVEIAHYQAAIKRVDKQFSDFMKMLQKNNYLKHSIVILISDHGEAVEMLGDRITDPDLFVAGKDKTIPRFYPQTSSHEKVNQSGGHGTDVLGLPQYHTVLAVRSFGTTKPVQKRLVPGLVSLLDIKPTILQMLNIPIVNANGHSLNKMIFGKQTVANQYQDFFTESDFSPDAIHTVHPETRKVLFEGINYFEINPKTARIVVKDDMLKMIISSKQYADFRRPWVLALYPQKDKSMMPILVNLETGQWTNDLSIPFALHSPAKDMLGAMKTFFKDDIAHLT